MKFNGDITHDLKVRDAERRLSWVNWENRLLYVLHHKYCLSYKDLAHITGLSTGAISQRIKRTQKKLSK